MTQSDTEIMHSATYFNFVIKMESNHFIWIIVKYLTFGIWIF